MNRPTLVGTAYRIDALAAAAKGELAAAVQCAQAAVAAHEQSPLRPELARSLLVLGRIERQRKRIRRAEAEFRRALAIRPGVALPARTDIGPLPLLERGQEVVGAAERPHRQTDRSDQPRDGSPQRRVVVHDEDGWFHGHGAPVWERQQTVLRRLDLARG